MSALDPLLTEKQSVRATAPENFGSTNNEPAASVLLQQAMPFLSAVSGGTFKDAVFP